MRWIQVENLFIALDRNRLQAGYDINQKAFEIVIVVIQRKPAKWNIPLIDPLAEQRGFAITGWCREEGELAGYLTL